MDDRKKGILYILSAAFFFALMNLFVKLGGDLPVWQKSFFRNLVAFAIALVILMKDHVKFRVGKGNRLFLFGRCMGGTLGILCNFYAMGQLNIADASMLNKLSPFFAMIFSIYILKEVPKKWEWAAILAAFAGALLVMKPSFHMESVPALLGALGGAGAGFAYTCVRRLGKGGVHGSVIVLAFSAFSCISVIPGVILTYAPMTAFQFVSLLLAGAAAAGGQFSITAAYTKAPAKEISVFDYTQVLFAALLSLCVLGQVPDLLSIAGYVIIIGTAVFKWKKGLKKKTM